MSYKTQIEIDISPVELAKVFSQYGSDEQALFFSTVAEEFKNFPSCGGDMQFVYMAKDMGVKGKNWIYTLANYLKTKHIDVNAPKFDMLSKSYPEQLL